MKNGLFTIAILFPFFLKCQIITTQVCLKSNCTRDSLFSLAINESYPISEIDTIKTIRFSREEDAISFGKEFCKVLDENVNLNGFKNSVTYSDFAFLSRNGNMSVQEFIFQSSSEVTAICQEFNNRTFIRLNTEAPIVIRPYFNKNRILIFSMPIGFDWSKYEMFINHIQAIYDQKLKSVLKNKN